MQTQNVFINQCWQQLLNGETHNLQSGVQLHQLEAMFAESSCQLWHCQSPLHEVYIKTLATQPKEQEGRQETPFWIMMRILFDMTLENSFRNASTTYVLLNELSPLELPQYQEGRADNNLHAIFISKVNGVSGCESFVDSQAINGLARYLAGSHQYQTATIGTLVQSENQIQSVGQTKVQIDSFAKRLKAFFKLMRQTELGSAFKVNEALIDNLKTQAIVPVMMDLRWDQFAFVNGELSGVFDLDAYVAAPIELDFVILEYLLSGSQLQEFATAYVRYSGTAIPDIDSVREVYRQLFFSVNALGESDYGKWMAQAKFFD